MKWIVIIIFVVIVCIFIRFLADFIKQRNAIAARGGVKVIYKTLIDNLLEYHSARIVQDKTDFVTIGGTFTDPISNRECGMWSVIIQPTFKTLNIKYQAHNDLGGGETVRKTWDFPINMSQIEMLSIIKKEADKWELYGIFK